MSEQGFKIGDKVELLVNYYTGENNTGPEKGSILNIVEECQTAGQWIDRDSVEVYVADDYPEEFKLLEPTTILVSTSEHEYQGLKAGDRYTAFITSDNKAHFKANGRDWILVQDDYILDWVETNDKIIANVNTRKVGKNRMELIDTGFPNAMMALGEVVTWASENKGYGDNDWKNISESSNAFVGAASRHRNKRFAGVEFDEESGLPHLYHEAFNVLAQLELYIEGKLK